MIPPWKIRPLGKVDGCEGYSPQQLVINRSSLPTHQARASTNFLMPSQLDYLNTRDSLLRVHSPSTSSPLSSRLPRHKGVPSLPLQSFNAVPSQCHFPFQQASIVWPSCLGRVQGSFARTSLFKTVLQSLFTRNFPLPVTCSLLALSSHGFSPHNSYFSKAMSCSTIFSCYYCSLCAHTLSAPSCVLSLISPSSRRFPISIHLWVNHRDRGGTCCIMADIL
jgi:hypothetical protein